MRVKICGVNGEPAFDAAAQASADWIGFVFFARSPRHVTSDRAAALSGRLSGGPARVGLFVDPTDDEVARVLDRVALHVLQLYAPAGRVAAIGDRFGVPVWRALAVSSAAELPVAGEGEAAWVVEPPAPAGASRPGGNAVTLDWRGLRGWRPALPWLLAGGLAPGNVARAIAESGAEAVDVSSGVESAPGVKDPALIAAFVDAARSEPTRTSVGP